ncbi:MAG: hypothetical protein J6A14_00935 [Spirochaetaceae bacterium]|nr:hypothetical protein [Spirochaetaceae bacterium]
MGYSLAFYKDKTGSGILTLSKFQRIVTIFAFLVVTGAFIFNALNHHSLWINGFFLILTFLACFYRESWYFSTKDQSITFSFGLAFWVKKNIIPIENINGIKMVKILQKSGKDKGEKIITTQLILTAGEKDAIIDSVKGRKTKNLELYATEIAKILGLELEKISI